MPSPLFSSPTGFGLKQKTNRNSNTGQLPYTPVPRNPDSKMYQPYYGYESDRRMPGERQGKEYHKYEKDYIGHRPQFR